MRSDALPDVDAAVVWAAVRARTDLGPVRAAAWLAAHGSLQDAVAGARRGRAGGVGAARRSALREALADPALRAAEAEVRGWRRTGQHVVGLGGEGYPSALTHLHDPPPLLFVRGRLPAALLAAEGVPRAVAVVGTRAASAWATAFARRLARDLARSGVVVVSGLALGVDGAAHRGALDAEAAGGTATVAVLAGGLDRVHPPHHTGLADAIAASGALVSEYPPGASPHRGSFPRRNRIVVGLAAALAVVQAPFRSGVRHSVATAGEIGRDLWVVPDRPESDVGRAAAALLADGASPLTGADDLLAALGARAHEPEVADGALGAVPDDPLERAIVTRIDRDGGLHEDAVMDLGGTVVTLLAALSRLEAGGWIERDEAGRWRRA